MHSWCGFESGSVLICRMFGEGWTGRLAQGQTDRINRGVASITLYAAHCCVM